MKENRILSWRDFFRKEMPGTLEEYKDLDRQNIEYIQELQEKRPLIKSPRDDPKQKVRDIAHLMVYASDRVSLRHPMLEHEGNCVQQTMEALVKKFTDSPSLVKAVSRPFQTLRLAVAGLNARTVKPNEIKTVNPETGEDLEREVRRLTGRPKCLRPNSNEFNLLVDAVAAKAKNLKDKRALAHIKTAGGVLTRVNPEDWPLLEKLRKRGEELVVTTREPSGSGHTDLITKINPKRGTVDTKVLGRRPIREVEKGMRLRRFPLTQIPPLEVAPPDQEEIKIRTKLYNLPWNPNIK